MTETTYNLSNCTCCRVPCTSLSHTLPKTLYAAAFYGGNDYVPFTVTWNATSSQWEYNGADILLCGNLYLRDAVFKCTGSAGVFFTEAAIYTIQQEQLGDGQFFKQLYDDDPLFLVISMQLTGYGITGTNCPDGSTLVIEFSETPI